MTSSCRTLVVSAFDHNWRQPCMFTVVVISPQVTESVLQRIPSERERSVLAVIETQKSSMSQKRALLAAQGLNRNLIDEIEVLVVTGKS
jgi:hypothetical protein